MDKEIDSEEIDAVLSFYDCDDDPDSKADASSEKRDEADIGSEITLEIEFSVVPSRSSPKGLPSNPDVKLSSIDDCFDSADDDFSSIDASPPNLLMLEDFFISDDEEFDRLQAIIDKRNPRLKSPPNASSISVGQLLSPLNDTLGACEFVGESPNASTNCSDLEPSSMVQVTKPRGSKRKLVIDEADLEVSFNPRVKMMCTDLDILENSDFMDECGDNDIKHLRGDVSRIGYNNDRDVSSESATGAPLTVQEEIERELNEIKEMFKQEEMEYELDSSFRISKSDLKLIVSSDKEIDSLLFNSSGRRRPFSDDDDEEGEECRAKKRVRRRLNFSDDETK